MTRTISSGASPILSTWTTRPGQGELHNLVKSEELVEAFLARDLVHRRDRHRGVDRAAFQSGVAGGATADLQECNVFVGIHVVFSENHYHFVVGRAAKTADADIFPFEIFHSFDARACDQHLVQAIHDYHDNDRQASLCGADEIGNGGAVIQTLAQYSVHDHLVPHNNDDSVEPFLFEKPFFLGHYVG